MKVLMIAECPYNLQEVKGGVESATINLINGFKSLDITLHVVSIYSSVQKAETVKFSDKIFIHYFPYTIKKLKLAEFFVFAKAKIRKVCKEVNPDIIHLQGTGPMLMLLRGINRKKVVITQHGIISEEAKYKISFKKKLKFFVKTFYDKYLLTKYSNFISISDYNRKILSEAQKNNKQFVTEIIHNAVNNDFFSAQPSGKRNRLIFVGLVNQLKGVHLLVEALKELKQQGITFTLDIVGGTKEPEYLEKIKQSIADSGLSEVVKLHGWVDQSGVKSLMAENTIFVLPSLQECLPISIAEAMASGKVVIATETGGIPEMFRNKESGFLFTKSDAHELAGILKHLYNNDQEVERISTNAKQEALMKFQQDSVAQATLNFYNKLLQKQ